MTMESLRRLGLTEYETKAYIALVKYGAMKGREVAEKSEVPPTRVFDTLKLLMNKGFVSLVSNKPMIFKAVRSEIAISGLIHEKKNELEALEKVSTEFLRNFKSFKQEASIEEKIIIVSGFEKMFNLANEMTNRSNKELLIFSSGEKIPNSTKLVSKNAIDRGVKIKFITNQYNALNISFLKELKIIGFEIRYYPAKDYTIAVQDSENSIIAIKNPQDQNNRITIFFDNKDFSHALSIWFKSIWKKAKIIKL